MRKFYVLGLMLTTVSAFFAVAAVSAFANEWLVEGNTVTTALLAETIGISESLELVAFKSELSTERLNTITCPDGIFDGFVGPGSLDLITEVLSLEAVKVELPGVGLNCKVTSSAGEIGDCANNTTDAEAWPVNLPWSTETSLSGTTFLDLVLTDGSGEPGWEVLCLTSAGLNVENVCTGEAANAELTNEATSPISVLGNFVAVGPGPERANCTLTGNHTGEVLKGEGQTWAVEGTTKLRTEVS
jgi:hypothetical protein